MGTRLPLQRGEQEVSGSSAAALGGHPIPEKRVYFEAAAKMHLNLRVRHGGAEDKAADAAETVDSHLCRHLGRSCTRKCTRALTLIRSCFAKGKSHSFRADQLVRRIPKTPCGQTKARSTSKAGCFCILKASPLLTTRFRQAKQVSLIA